MLGYTSWHCLFVYSCNSYFFSTYVVIQLYVNYLFNMLFSYLLSAVYHIVICSYCFYARAPFPSHTLIRSLLMTLDSHVQGIRHLLILFRCSCDRTLHEELELLSFWFWYSYLSLFLLLFIDSYVSHLASIPSFLSEIMCSHYMYYCSVNITRLRLEAWTWSVYLRTWLWYQKNSVTPRFLKYIETESRRESAT